MSTNEMSYKIGIGVKLTVRTFVDYSTLSSVFVDCFIMSDKNVIKALMNNVKVHLCHICWRVLHLLQHQISI